MILIATMDKKNNISARYRSCSANRNLPDKATISAEQFGSGAMAEGRAATSNGLFGSANVGGAAIFQTAEQPPMAGTIVLEMIGPMPGTAGILVRDGRDLTG